MSAGAQDPSFLPGRRRPSELGSRASPQPSGSISTLRMCALYPDLMNIYADRGNVLMLERRCAWRGIDFQLAERGIGDRLEPNAYDLIYLGGGQDRDQLLCADDLVNAKGAEMRAAAQAGTVILGVCGGYQLLGRFYELAPGQRIEGLGLLGVNTVRQEGPRLIGNVAIEVDLGEGAKGDGAAEDRRAHVVNGAADAGADDRRMLAGFENHGGRTSLHPGQAPLGRVIRGYGNDGASGFEGARSGNVIGTYMHGPLLPKNAWFADWLIARALRIDPASLAGLDDTLEQAVHLGALRAAGL